MGGEVKCGLIFEDMQVWGLRDCDNCGSIIIIIILFSNHKNFTYCKPPKCVQSVQCSLHDSVLYCNIGLYVYH